MHHDENRFVGVLQVITILDTKAADKWRLLGGKLYRLDGEYEKSVEAIQQAKFLSMKNHVHISRTDDGTWVVYWRPRSANIECPLTHQVL